MLINSVLGFFNNLPKPGLFRLLLALAVVVFHSLSVFPVGHYAVYVFFILSGYWIFKMYHEKYSTYKNSYTVYISSRLLRLLPLYWVLLIFTCLIYYFIPAQHEKVNLALGDDYFMMPANIFVLGMNFVKYWFIVPAWSLDIEIQFYLLAPVLLVLANSGRWKLLLALSVVIAVATIYTLKYATLLTYLPFFLIGGAIYFQNFFAKKQISRLGLIIAAVILAVNYAIPVLRAHFFDSKFTLYFVNYQEAINITLAFFTIPYITRNVRAKISNRQTDMVLSSMSYSVYLVHWPLLIVYSTMVQDKGGVVKLLFLAGYYVGCLIAAYLISVYLDTTLENYRKKVLTKFHKVY